MRLYDEMIMLELRREGFRRTFRSRAFGQGLVIYTKTEGPRKIDVQLFEGGYCRASHMLNGRGSTVPTDFTDVPSLRLALQRERTRTDHTDR